MNDDAVPAGDRLARALELLDRANAEDPTRIVFEGREWPYEVFYASQVTKWLLKLAPEASEALRLAARSQHLRRWKIPRATYPTGRAGYLRWRAELKRFHAEESAAVLRSAGCDETTIRRVQRLNLKSDLGHDLEMQTLEDALCLVTLEHQLEDLMRKYDEEKLIRILQRTWRRMSPAAQSCALALNLSASSRALVEKALSTLGKAEDTAADASPESESPRS